MITLLAAGARLQAQLEALDWQFCFIGGIANFRWGIPRLTIDLDLTLLTGFGHEDRYVSELLGMHESRVRDAREFALRNRVVLLRTEDGIGVDVALGAMPFEEATIARSSVAELAPGIALRTCSAEDLVVHKAFAARPQDWVDIEGVTQRQQGRLLWDQIWADLTPLVELKGELEILTQLQRIVALVEKSLGSA